ncbi:hypothetical protein ACIPJS_02520 [Streptomyces sp. NPDC086783]|uniref:hypothetical protein n=1 Tax=Streptomyces sp. NPDC086783 TaxID=3365758 RepID=UPI003829ED1F
MCLIDRNGSFPSACSAVPLAPDKLLHTGPLDAFDRSQAGIYQISVPEWTYPGMPHPLGRQVGGEPYTNYKTRLSIALRLLWPKRPESRSPFWRPDWRMSMVAEASVRHWTVAFKAVQTGRHALIALRNVDAVQAVPDSAISAAVYGVVSCVVTWLSYTRGLAMRAVSVASFMRTGSGTAFVRSDAPLWLDIEESDRRWGRGKHRAKAGEYGPPLFPVLRVNPV